MCVKRVTQACALCAEGSEQVPLMRQSHVVMATSYEGGSSICSGAQLAGGCGTQRIAQRIQHF